MTCTRIPTPVLLLLLLLLLPALPLLLAPTPLAAQPDTLELSLEPVVGGLDLPVGAVHAGDGSGRLFVLEQTGAVRIVRDGEILPEPFLDLSRVVSCCGERGLLGLAFHPDFPDDDRFFVHFTVPLANTRVVEYRVSAGDPDRADPASARTLLALGQPFGNHNGGQLAFGPDGYLYIGLGDGGGAGDPLGNGQDVTTLLGAILRIDVDRTDPGLPYAVPPDNPTYPGVPGARREIWAYGLRNPWRFGFDRATGDLFVGDVGQSRWEEIDLLPADTAGAAGPTGWNLGWSRKEGDHCFDPPAGCEIPGLVDPILEYSHDEGCSVTGGFRYRGAASPPLDGVYVYGDFCRGTVWGADPDPGGGAWSAAELLDTGFALSSFGEDEAGELYVTEYAPAPGGRLHRLVGPPGEPDPEPPPAPDDGWLTTPEIPGFRFRVQITSGGVERPVRQETGCIPETLCVSGAVPGRSELFVRIVGPKPNGKLWPTLVRFTTSTVEVWIEQLATGETRHYLLAGAVPGSSELEGLFDRDGFEP
ncbi:MAG: PQQ-dependent sugar dehydrogenase [Acidobacteriota bacterium]|jgi:hypothetical protein